MDSILLIAIPPAIRDIIRGYCYSRVFFRDKYGNIRNERTLNTTGKVEGLSIVYRVTGTIALVVYYHNGQESGRYWFH